MNDEIRIRISDILFAFEKYWKLIVATSAAGLLVGIVLTAITYLQTPLVSYSINGSFAISSISESGSFIGQGGTVSYNDFYLAENMVPSIRYVLNSSRIVKAAISDEKLIGIEAADVQQRISLTQYGKTQIIDMTLIWRSPEEGLDLWNAIINAGNRYIPQMLQVGTLVIINEPRAEPMGITRTGPKLAIILTVFGAILGMGYALLTVLLHPTLSNLKDVDSVLKLETIGMISQNTTWQEENGNLADGNKDAEANEHYSATTYILRNRLGRRNLNHCFYVTSATEKEGKSKVAANIALQLSEMECRTLLIDYDTRNPDIGPMFLSETDYDKSLNALYRGEANEYDVIVKVNGYLDLIQMIPEHQQIPLDGTIEDFFTSLTAKYQYVVINASPVGVVSGALSLNQVTNKAIFVVGYDTAPMEEIKSTIRKMDKSGTQIIGCVVYGVKGKANKSVGAGNHRKKGRTRKNHPVKVPEQTGETGSAQVDEMLNQLNNQEKSRDDKGPTMALEALADSEETKNSREPGAHSIMEELFEGKEEKILSSPDSALQSEPVLTGEKETEAGPSAQEDV